MVGNWFYLLGKYWWTPFNLLDLAWKHVNQPERWRNEHGRHHKEVAMPKPPSLAGRAKQVSVHLFT